MAVRPTRIAAITGFSGAGKTTMILELIARFRREGSTVGAIKHTHHPLNEEDRGDTGRFRRAGAEPVILAGQLGEAVIFADEGISRVAYAQPQDLLAHFSCDIVLVEGFKELGTWPQVSIHSDARPTVEEVAATLDRIWEP